MESDGLVGWRFALERGLLELLGAGQYNLVVGHFGEAGQKVLAADQWQLCYSILHPQSSSCNHPRHTSVLLQTVPPFLCGSIGSHGCDN